MNPIRLKDGQADHPCGQCIACREQRASEWAARLTHEAQYHKEPLFLTLTYNDESLPGPTLVPGHLTAFTKAINALLARQGRKFKYFGSGEYGSEEYTERPHYHLITYGLELKDFEPIEIFEEIKYKIAQWDSGFIDVKPFLYERARYTAKYILKQMEMGSEYTYRKKGSVGRYPPFRRSSQGLGLQWAKDNKKQMEKDGFITIKGHRRTIPRYYVKVLGLEFPEGFLKERQEELDQEQQELYRASLRARVIEDEMKRIDYDFYDEQRLQRKKNAEAKIRIKELKKAMR